ncbi:hypothetical protein Zmor_012932 [Zophobas morio]|uniref:Uncharacterized protein n=1 Tax=Zophobas morio TaxID=2755281 RepID=A0AA38MF39_9CUCU|nr:hypothetical protein Zmor_012932 [Zophobas morio]
MPSALAIVDQKSLIREHIKLITSRKLYAGTDPVQFHLKSRDNRQIGHPFPRTPSPSPAPRPHSDAPNARRLHSSNFLFFSKPCTSLASLSNVVKYLSVLCNGGDASSHPYSASSRRRRRCSVQCADGARVQQCSRAAKNVEAPRRHPAMKTRWCVATPPREARSEHSEPEERRSEVRNQDLGALRRRGGNLPSAGADRYFNFG